MNGKERMNEFCTKEPTNTEEETNKTNLLITENPIYFGLFANCF